RRPMAEIRNTQVILSRLEKIERENRIMKRCLTFIAIAFGAVFTMAQVPLQPRTVEAERLVIRYPNGKDPIVLETDDRFGGRAAAYFLPPDDRKTGGASVLVGSRESGLHLSSPQNRLKLEMTAGGDGSEEHADLGMTVGTYPIYNVGVNNDGAVS